MTPRRERSGSENLAGRVLAFYSVSIKDLSRLPSLDLLRYFFHQGTLDQSILVNWIAAQCSVLPTGTNLPQFAFVALMCDEYFDLIQRSRAVSVPVVEGCMLRLGEVCPSLFEP